MIPWTSLVSASTARVSSVFLSSRLLISTAVFSVCRAISEEMPSERLAAISRAAAWTPASIERKRLSRMNG
jgi:hypothetical protein